MTNWLGRQHCQGSLSTLLHRPPWPRSIKCPPFSKLRCRPVPARPLRRPEGGVATSGHFLCPWGSWRRPPWHLLSETLRLRATPWPWPNPGPPLGTICVPGEGPRSARARVAWLMAGDGSEGHSGREAVSALPDPGSWPPKPPAAPHGAAQGAALRGRSPPGPGRIENREAPGSRRAGCSVRIPGPRSSSGPSATPVAARETHVVAAESLPGPGAGTGSGRLLPPDVLPPGG